MNRIAQLKEFLKESPNDNFLIHALALEYVKMGDDKEATTYFESNRRISPGYVATYYHFGKLLEGTGKIKEAIYMYECGMKVAKECMDEHAYSELRSAHEELTFL